MSAMNSQMVQKKKKEGKQKRNMEKERKEKKYTQGKRKEREREREKENLAHLVNLGGEYMGVHFTILATFLKVLNFENDMLLNKNGYQNMALVLDL